MIQTDITGRNYEPDAKIAAYVEQKIAGLEKYLPKHVRDTAYATVVLQDDANARNDTRYVCDTTISVQGDQFHAQEGAINMYASIDIVEAKLKAQMAKYKEIHTTEPRRGKMMTRLIGRTSETDPATPEPLTDADER